MATPELIDAAVRGGIIIDESLLEDIRSRLSKIEQAVYEAVPIEQPWRLQQVVNEVRRSTAVNYSLSIIRGTMNNLITSGLVIETSCDVFVRETIHASASSGQEPTDLIKPDQKTDNNEDLADIFTELYESASSIVFSVEKLKENITKAAHEVSRQMSASEEKAKKLVELRALLQGITG